MTTISRLSICGIRSFGPHEEQNIKFTTPVTLILGENGCGKTTIIESLRYACTGEYPIGSDSGKGFLQEPKLSNSSTTKGRVKLKIIDSKANNIVISRAARLEIKHNGKASVSKLDATIESTKPDGTRAALSSRCADIGEQVYTILGVPKPILNNVIFCHQEHSSWPLDESSQVKKKFDEIFDATKYNKCIEDLRKYAKTQKNNLDILKKDVECKKERKDWVEKRRADMVTSENELSEKLASIVTKKNELTPITNEINKICELENTLSSIQGELASKQTEQKSLVRNRQSVLAKIKKEFTGSDYELSEEIKNFERSTENNIKEIENFEHETTQIQKEINNVNVQIQKAQVRLGQLETEKRQQCERIQERNKQINLLGKQLKVAISVESEDEVIDTIKLITKATKNSETELKAEREKDQQQERSLQEHIDSCRETVIKLIQERNLNIEQRKEVQNKQRDTNSQIKRLDVSDELLKTLNNKINTIDRQIKFLTESLDPNELDTKIKINKEEIQSLERKLESLEKDYSVLQKNYVIEENIATRTKDITKKDSKIFELKNANYQNFKLLLDEIPDTDLKLSVEKRQKQNNTELEDIKRKIDIDTQKVTSNSTKNRMNGQKLKSLQKKLSKNQQMIFEVLQNKPYEKTCLDLERGIEKLQKSRGQFSSAKIMYEKFIKDFQSDKPCCPVCETDFNNKRSLANNIVTKIKAKIENIPQELERVETELKKKQELFNRAQQLKPLYEESKELEEVSIPVLLKEISESEEIVRISEVNLKEFNDKIKTPKQLIDIANKVIGDAALIDKYKAEVDSYEKEIRDLRGTLIPLKIDKSREEVDRDLKVCRTTINDKRKSCDADSKKLEDYRREHQELKDEKSKILKDRLDLEKSMHCKPQLLEQVTSLQEQEEKLDNGITRIENELEPAKEALAMEKRKLDQTKAENETKYKESMKEHNKIKSALENILSQQKSIETTEKENYEEQLKTLLENFKTYKNKEESLSNRKKELSEKRMELKENLAKAEVMKRNLEDNVEIRKKATEIDVLDVAIKELQQKVGEYNYTSLQKQKQQLQTQYTNLVKQISNLSGQKEMLEKTIDDKKKELEKPENKGAYNLYKQKYNEYVVKELAIADAKTYCKGLEDAIIQFHKDKMSKINSTIRDLWRSVYKGNDIDYIQIRTEVTSENTSSGRRTYDYKVVQFKNEVEVDMRGRCSAGQKVLACLLIRMALAMTFSHNCGILALDEPTTNLDRENVHSLCETLASMINSRRFEKSFQLLIITHDEEFIKKLSQAERLDSWLRVKRNPIGNTCIETEYNN